MKIACPNCGFSGNVKDELIPEGGRNIGCPKCKKQFFVEKETDFLLEDVDKKTKRILTPKNPKKNVRATEGDSFWNKHKSCLIPLIIIFAIAMVPLYVVGSCVHSCSSDNKTDVVEKEKPKPPKTKEKPKEVPEKYTIALKDGTIIKCDNYREEGETVYFSNEGEAEGFVSKDTVSMILEGTDIVYRKKYKGHSSNPLAEMDLSGKSFYEIDTKSFHEYDATTKNKFLNSDYYKNKKCMVFGKVTDIGENDSPKIYGSVKSVVRIVTYAYVYADVGTNEDLSNLRVGDRVKAYGYFSASYNLVEFKMSYATFKLYDKEYMGYSKNLWDVER